MVYISRTTERKLNGTKLKFLTPEQINHFLNTCERHWPEYRHFFQFLFMTGTRLGEAMAATWDDVGWDDKVVSINEAPRRKRTGYSEGNVINLIEESLAAQKLDQSVKWTCRMQ